MSLIPINLGVPTGTVMWYAGQTVPYGWLLCDGSTFSVAEFPVLASYLGSTYGPVTDTEGYLPDMVGKFLRGFGAEPGRLFGSTQDDMFSVHEHGFRPIVHKHGITDPGHIHQTNNVTHIHTTSGNHAHEVPPLAHTHKETYPSVGYTFIALDPEETEAYYVGYKYCAESHVSGFFCPLGVRNVKRTYDVATTGVSVDTNVTGITISNFSFTGVIFLRGTTGIALDFSETGISVDDFGAPNTRPVNIALLPIIRT